MRYSHLQLEEKYYVRVYCFLEGKKKEDILELSYRETRNPNTNNSNELQFSTDYGFNFVDAILFRKKKKPSIKTDCVTHPMTQSFPLLSGSVS